MKSGESEHFSISRLKTLWLWLLLYFLSQQLNSMSRRQPWQNRQLPPGGHWEPWLEWNPLSCRKQKAGNLMGGTEQERSNIVDSTWKRRASFVSSPVMPLREFRK